MVDDCSMTAEVAGQRSLSNLNPSEEARLAVQNTNEETAIARAFAALGCEVPVTCVVSVDLWCFHCFANLYNVRSTSFIAV